MSTSAKLPGRKLSALVLCAFLAGAAGLAWAADPPDKEPADALRVANDLSTAFEYTAGKVRPSVVSIRSIKHFKPSAEGRGQLQPQLPEGLPFGDDFLRRFFGDRLPNQLPPQEGLGSGVIVSPDGYILTNNHVVGGADEVTVTTEDKTDYRAEVVGKDPLSDLAVIRVKANDLPAAKLGDSDKLKVGEWVVAAGNPFGLTDTITAGIVSAKGRSNMPNMRIAEYEDFIQTDAAINPGNSGGPLVNLRGEVVGINTAIASRTGGNNGVGFAIPINMAKSIMESLIGKGKVTRGWLGVSIQPLTEGMAKSFGYSSTEGALVGDVIKGGPAEQAGLEQGDIITSFDGTPIKDVTQFRNLVAAAEPGAKAKLEVFRDGQTKTITVKLAERSESETGGEAGAGQADELGLTTTNLTPDIRRALNLGNDVEGVAISEVDPNGIAYTAGLRAGQVILDVQGKPVTSVSQFKSQIARQDLKTGIRLRVQVGDQQVYVLLRAEK
jgi:serine protease Do